MPLSKAVADQIVSEVEAVLPAQIELIDTDGTVLASSIPGRAGLVHGGAKQMAEKNLKELLVRCDGEYGGALQSIPQICRQLVAHADRMGRLQRKHAL